MSLREQTRLAVSRVIAEKAIELFDRQGFEETTVDDIAAVTDISSRSFFRYFASKEDVVIGDSKAYGLKVRDALLARPIEESPWKAMRAALQLIVVLAEANPEPVARNMRVVFRSPSLRARNLEKHLLWAEIMVPVVVERLNQQSSLPPTDDTLPARAIIVAALSCLDVAFSEWVEKNASEPFGNLLDRSFESVRPL